MKYEIFVFKNINIFLNAYLVSYFITSIQLPYNWIYKISIIVQLYKSQIFFLIPQWLLKNSLLKELAEIYRQKIKVLS